MYRDRAVKNRLEQIIDYNIFKFCLKIQGADWKKKKSSQTWNVWENVQNEA